MENFNITILLGFNNSGKSTWMLKQNPDVWITGYKHKSILENSLIAFEHPELGLHPNLHAEVITNIINWAKTKNNNIIVETHSEVMVMRIRRLIACKMLDFSNVNFYWFDNNNIKEIKINENAQFYDFLPDGFFEEAYNEFDGMMDLKPPSKT